MNKNTLKIGMTSAAAGLLFVGCDFLTKTPQAVESKDVFWKTEDQANKALIGAYDPAGWGGTTETYEWMIGDIMSDDAVKGGEGPNDFAEVEQMRNFNTTADNFVLEERWQANYYGIGRCNQVIENIPKMPASAFADAATPARLIAEAKFLRGFYYFELVNTFGAVPISTKVLTKSEYCFAKSTVDQVWAQIIADFTDAAAGLPEKGATDVGRATKSAALGMLAKSYVYTGDWAKAATTADQVISSGVYSLDADFTTIFTQAHQNDSESIFEIQHTNDGTADWGDDNEGTITQIFQGPRGNAQPGAEVGWGFDIPTDDLNKLFDKAKDTRYHATILNVGDTLWPGMANDTLVAVPENPLNRNNKKYFWEYNAPSNVPAMSDDPANWRVMRYADLLLLRAEAAVHLDDLPKATTLLNQIRTRAKVDLVTALPAGTALDTVYLERRKELALEGQRYFDLVRTGKADVVLASRGYKPTKRYLPIPQLELDRCTDLKQNEDYFQ